MYLNQTQLKQILKFNGFDLSLIEKIFVSCEHNGDKISGTLFHKLQNIFPKIQAEKILHIGDKFEADVESPRSLGINAFHYDVISRGLKKFVNMKRYAGLTPNMLILLENLQLIFRKTRFY